MHGPGEKRALCDGGLRAFYVCRGFSHGQPLGRNIPAVVQHVIQALLNHIRQILRQHLGGFRLVNGRNRLAGLRNLRKLARQGVVDDLFV